MPVTLQDVKEDSTYQVTGTFKDEAGVALAAASLTTVKMWLTDHKNVVINARIAVDIRNAGPGTPTRSRASVAQQYPSPRSGTWATGKKSHESIFLMVVNDSQVPTT